MVHLEEIVLKMFILFLDKIIGNIENLILAGNFNMTNSNELFNSLIELGQHPKEYTDTVIIMEKIGHFLDDAVRKMYKDFKELMWECSSLISEKLDILKFLKNSKMGWRIRNRRPARAW